MGAIWGRAWQYFGATFGHTRTTLELLGDYQVTTVDLTGMNSGFNLKILVIILSKRISELETGPAWNFLGLKSILESVHEMQIF